ncbi:MAG TPA: PQQ-binding-like beta-propeller repeat protein, partial [Planctomycetota bacterium]|nr:PQQ-binding-like beta-propeller repeat protein [Planctomycetota bacterium]
MGLFPCDIPSTQSLAVVPVLVGPLQALLAILPGLLAALGATVLALFKPSTFKKLLLLLWSQKIPVLVITVVIGSAWWGIPALLPPPEVSARQAGTDWSVWRGDAARRGAVTGDEDPARGFVNWRFIDGKIKAFYASPAVVGNRLYITSAEPVFDKGAIYGIDTASGKVVWRYAAEDTGRGYLATFSSPAVSGKYLVVGEGLHFTKNARVFCLDVEASERERRGVRLWSFETKSHVESSPCIAEGLAVIGAGDDGLYCFALEPDANGNAVVLWHLAGKDYPDCEAAPVIHEGKVYFSLGINGNAVVCVDAKTGTELWRHPAGFPVFGSPTIADGKLFVGMGPGNFMFTAEEVAAQERAKLKEAGKTDAEIEAAVKDIRPFGKVICLDLSDGKPLWEYEVGRTVLGA